MTVYNAQFFDRASGISDVLQTRNMHYLQGVRSKVSVKKLRAKYSNSEMHSENTVLQQIW